MNERNVSNQNVFPSLVIYSKVGEINIAVKATEIQMCCRTIMFPEVIFSSEWNVMLDPHPGRTSTVLNDRIRKNTTKYLAQYYDRKSPCRIRSNTTIYGEKYDRLRFSYMESVYDLRFSPYFAVYGRISPYTTRWYTIVILSHVLRPNTIVYGDKRNVYGRLRPYMDSVNLDLGFRKRLNEVNNIALKRLN